MKIALYILLFSSILMATKLAAKDYYTNCNGCSENVIKSTAEAVYVPLFGRKYIHIFDDTNKRYYKYKLTARLIDDDITVTVATRVSQIPSVASAYQRYVLDKESAFNFFNGHAPIALEGQGGLLFSSEQVSDLKTANKTVSCVANEVPEDSMSVYKLVQIPALRNQLYYNISNSLSTDASGKITALQLSSGSLINELELASNGTVALAGATIEQLDLGNMKFTTPDGGFIKGYLDLNQETFQIKLARDGDCNDVSVEPAENQAYVFSNSTAYNEGIAHFTSFLGGKIGNLPTCQKSIKACTGVNGIILSCTSICMQWK